MSAISLGPAQNARTQYLICLSNRRFLSCARASLLQSESRSDSTPQREKKRKKKKRRQCLSPPSRTANILRFSLHRPRNKKGAFATVQYTIQHPHASKQSAQSTTKLIAAHRGNAYRNTPEPVHKRNLFDVRPQTKHNAFHNQPKPGDTPPLPLRPWCKQRLPGR